MIPPHLFYQIYLSFLEQNDRASIMIESEKEKKMGGGGGGEGDREGGKRERNHRPLIVYI